MDAPGDGRETSNATIGTFTANADGSFSGAIRALALGGRAARIRPCEKIGERGPDYRVSAEGADPRAAWRKPGRGDGELSMRRATPASANRSTPP